MKWNSAHLRLLTASVPTSPLPVFMISDGVHTTESAQHLEHCTGKSNTPLRVVQAHLINCMPPGFHSITSHIWKCGTFCISVCHLTRYLCNRTKGPRRKETTMLFLAVGHKLIRPRFLGVLVSHVQHGSTSWYSNCNWLEEGIIKSWMYEGCGLWP